MSIKCSNCGYELPDGAKFCGNCGTTVTAQAEKKFCTNCGNTLRADAKFCGVCGATVSSAPAVEEKPAQPEQPTMDEIVPPVITDETFASAAVTTKHEDDPSFESIELPKMDAVQPAQAAAPKAPTAEEIAAASRSDSVAAQTPTVAATPIINDSYYTNSAQPAQTAAQPTPAPQASSVPNVPNVPNMPYPDPSKGNAQPGKNSGVLIPIILIILIIAVIAVDIFVLFPDRIFGKDDSSASKEAAAVVQTVFADSEL